jgi:cytochrome P450
MASSPGSAFATVSHDLHRQRRGVMNPYFSKQRIVALEQLIRSKTTKLAYRFLLAAQDASIIRLDVAFMALTTDVFSDYAFGYCDNYLDEQDFKSIWLETIHGGFECASQSRQMPWLQPLVVSLPRSFLQKALPQIYFFLRWQDGIRIHIDRIMREPSPTSEQKERPKTMFHALRDCALPAAEKTSARIVDEGLVIMGAASETVAHTLSITTYHLMSEPGQAMIARLRAELQTIMLTAESTPTYPQLEQLPYLSAVIAEGIRMGWGVTTRLPRIANDEDLVYTDGTRDGKEWVIPRGTPVSSTGYFVLSDPMIFTEPHTFNPDRWLIVEEGTVRRNFKLERYLVSFGKGSRQCLGMNLAYAELFLTLPMLVWQVFPGFELFETRKERDVDLKHDWFTGMPELGSPGIRVRVKGGKAYL